MQKRQEGQMSIMAEDSSTMTFPVEQIMILDSPNDAAENLALLAFEMADPEQDLSVQQPGCGATTFTCFPKLALELRLMIWRAAFPRGRMVKIEAQVVNGTYYGPPFPLTLMTNQESRKKTLRNYLLYCQDDELLNRLPEWAHLLQSSRNLQQQPRPICYSPGRDYLFVTWLEQSLTYSLLELIIEKCKPIGKIQILGTDYFHEWTGVFPNSTPLEIRIFHDLKEICCVIHPGANAPGDEWYKSEVIEALSKAFDLEREKFPSLNTPKISFFDSVQDLERNMRFQGW